MYPFRTTARIAAVAFAFTALVACADETFDPVDTPEAAIAAMSMNPHGPAAPGGLVPVSFGGNTLMVWPLTGGDFEGDVADPLNIVFAGEVDVLSLRAALRSLDGNRTAFGLPNAPPFNCTWTDASGEMQTAYTDEGGWVANPVQLQCGDYGPVRFHIRLFPAGDWVVAGTHFDLLIPGTSQHRVISWELAEQMIYIDFVRSGLVNPATGVAHAPLSTPGPAGDVIEAPLYNGLPPSLQAVLGVVPNGSGNYVALTDGAALVLDVMTRTPVVPDVTESSFTIEFGQSIPRPYCATGPNDWVHVTGPMDISTRFQVNERGQMQSHNVLRATLEIAPFDLSTGLPAGPMFRAHVSQIDDTGINAGGVRVNSQFEEMALPPGVGFLRTHMVTGPNGLANSTHIERCN